MDTGSSNTWVGADPDNPYVATSTSIDTGEGVVSVHHIFPLHFKDLIKVSRNSLFCMAPDSFSVCVTAENTYLTA